MKNFPIIFFIFLISCGPIINYGEPEGLDNSKWEKHSSLKDSIFSYFKKRIASSNSVKLIYNECHPEKRAPEDEYPESLGPVNTVLGSASDKNRIMNFIDDHIDIERRADTIKTCSCLTYFDLYFICSKDTLIDMSWDLAKGQINIRKEWFKIDFKKLSKGLDLIKK